MVDDVGGGPSNCRESPDTVSSIKKSDVISCRRERHLLIDPASESSTLASSSGMIDATVWHTLLVLILFSYVFLCCCCCCICDECVAFGPSLKKTRKNQVSEHPFWGLRVYIFFSCPRTVRWIRGLCQLIRL